MDIEEYYFHTKDRKGRNLAAAFKRRENAWRKQMRSRGAVDGVSKQIQVAGDWDADRINEFCEDVLQDGGMLVLRYNQVGRAGAPSRRTSPSIRQICPNVLSVMSHDSHTRKLSCF